VVVDAGLEPAEIVGDIRQVFGIKI
jgi:hypothetical protein